MVTNGTFCRKTRGNQLDHIFVDKDLGGLVDSDLSIYIDYMSAKPTIHVFRLENLN